MTLEELKELVDNLVEGGHSLSAKVRFVYQERYPLQDEVKGVAILSDITDGDTAACTAEDTIYLVSDGQVYDDPYGPRAAWDVVSY